MMTLHEFLQKDEFARNTGIRLLEVKEGYSKASMEVTRYHMNAGGTTQGGAIFTLADFALAAAANSHGKLSLTLTSGIHFFRTSGPGDVLTAQAREKFIHKRTSFYQVDVTNQEGELIASLESTMYRKDTGLELALE